MKIEIHDNDTNETGTHKIWFTVDGIQKSLTVSEAFSNSLLNMSQKEDFFMGAYKFEIKSPYDQKLLLRADPNQTLRHSAEITEGFICKGCEHKLPQEYSAEGKEYCYLCDPN